VTQLSAFEVFEEGRTARQAETVSSRSRTIATFKGQGYRFTLECAG